MYIQHQIQMMHCLTIVVCLLLSVSCFSAKLPASFKKCNKKDPNFAQCLSVATENAIKQLTKPFNQVNLPSLEPLEIEKLTIKAGSNVVAFQQNFKNVKVWGNTNLNCSNFSTDFKTGHQNIVLKCFYPEIKLQADYDIDGKVLQLPIKGQGKAEIVLKHLDTELNYKLADKVINGVNHWKVVNSKIHLKPKKVTYHFGNLFNGDNKLGDNINKVLNENWSEVFQDVKPQYEEVFQKIAATIFNGLLEKVPKKDLFGEN